MTIWVDADACPKVIRGILIKAAERTACELVFVANHSIQVPPYPNVRSLVVPAGFDVADNEIVQRATAADLVVTSDIPLAAELIDKGAQAISPRGEVYSKDTIRARLSMRDFMDTMRSSGVHGGGPPPLGEPEKRAFANALDTYLARHPG